MTKHSSNITTMQGRLAVRPGGSSFPLRAGALMLMLAGAAGFFITLVVYGEQMLCLLGSTLLTFVGLGLTITARRRLNEQAGETAVEAHGAPDVADFESEQAALPTVEEADWPHATLSDFAVDTFRRWGGEVTIEQAKENRFLLHILAADGKKYVALVFEQPEQVGIDDARGLYALINNAGGQGGFLISDGGITDQAKEWARRRRIALVDRAWLNGAGM